MTMMDTANATNASDFCTPYNTVNLSNPDRATRWMYTETQQLIMGIVNPVLGTSGVVGNLAFLWNHSENEREVIYCLYIHARVSSESFYPHP